MGGSSLGGAVERRFIGRGGQYGSEDEEELNNRVNTFERQQFLPGFVTPKKRRDTNIDMLNTRFLSTRKDMSQDILASAKRIKDLQRTVFTTTKFLRHTGQTFQSSYYNFLPFLNRFLIRISSNIKPVTQTAHFNFFLSEKFDARRARR